MFPQAGSGYASPETQNPAHAMIAKAFATIGIKFL
jgi:hypothetical protein